MADLRPGQAVLLKNGLKGTVRFYGQTDFAPGVWVGVELEENAGKNDGSVKGIRYFDCAQDHGMFLKPEAVQPIAQPPAKAPLSKPPRPSSFNPAAGRVSSAIQHDQVSSQVANQAACERAAKLLNLTNRHSSRSRTISRFKDTPPYSGAGRDSGKEDSADGVGSPLKDEVEILSPQPRSPAVARSNTVEKLTASANGNGARKSPAAARTRDAPGGAAASTRELEELRAKVKILERKRGEDREKLQQLEKVQGERDKFENIIQKLQQKYQPLQQENSELKREIKEAQDKFQSIEDFQASYETDLEMARLDRELAEEVKDSLQYELDELKIRAQELQLELELAKHENEGLTEGMSSEERASAGWLQMESDNQRMREALVALRDITRETEHDLRDRIQTLEDETKDFGQLRERYDNAQAALQHTEQLVEELKLQLDDALGATKTIEDLSEQNLSLLERVATLQGAVEELESLNELSNELEANYIQHNKELLTEIDFKDAVIQEQARRYDDQRTSLNDLEHTLSRFRELVTTLQSDLDDMRATQAVTEGESEKLNERSRAMQDLNMKLQISASKAQAKSIDLELRRLEAQEAEQHLAIVKLFLPDSYKEDQDSVLAFLRFRRLAFKAGLLSSFIKERVTGQPQPGHENDNIAGCDAIDKLVWLSSTCDRFVHDMSCCSVEQFSKYENALHELEPVERALNGWIEGLRREDFKEQKCADELQRTMSLMTHLAEVHIPESLASFADECHAKSVTMHSQLDSAALVLTTLRNMVQRVIPAAGEENELAEHFAQRMDAAISKTRSVKVAAQKTVRSLDEQKKRSLALLPETRDYFEQTEHATQQVVELARHVGYGVHKLMTQDEGRAEPFTYIEVRECIQRLVLETTLANESDILFEYVKKLEVAGSKFSDLSVMADDHEQMVEFDVGAAPWKLRSAQLKALKTVPLDAEEELRRLKEECSESRRTIAQRDENLSTAMLKIDTLEARMRDAQANLERITTLQTELQAAGEEVAGLKEEIAKQDHELKDLETERDKWQKIASDSQAFADTADEAGAKAGQERAVATAREMDALKKDIGSLQAAVRFLREDNRRARLTEQPKHDWLAEPLKKPASAAAQRRALVASEGRDVLGELVKMATSSTVFDFSKLPEDKLAWRPARATPQYHAAKQREDYEAWKDWQSSVLRKTELLTIGKRAGREKRLMADPAARLQIRLPGSDGKMLAGSGQRVQIVGSQEWESLQGRLGATA
ncbi:Dynactin [Emericellopsis cladophorae]|uniref:Dynactin n=1 Tax=Emericellopsis cladophorae TaxID=2686198 RepID=A0A9P9XY23_9HYPO|nr:Dynactin [Emericellopsis cladophorae]KAI6779815.1 Dynactin [Emericellopsis cladophorae]